jgi:hypothetical protein
MEPWADPEQIADWRNLQQTELLLAEIHRRRAKALAGLRAGAKQGEMAKASNDEGKATAYEDIINLITVTDAR